jgi:hypothetical protein
MRGYKKFLFKNKWHVFSFFFKKRILNFKRTKWKKIKSKIFYLIRQYHTYKKRLISLKFCIFFKNIKFLKKKTSVKNFIFNIKFLKFFKKLKIFIMTKKYKKLKRNLKYKLNFFFKKPFYQKFNFFQRCFNLFFFNYKTNKISNKQHIRNKFFFKNTLFSKAAIIKYYYGCFSVKFFKKQILTKIYKQDLANIFIKPEFRLDILLWRLKFFSSPYLARFAFQKNLITLNKFNNIQKSFNKHFFKKILKKGDVISFKSVLKYKYKKNLNSTINSFFLPTVFEFDYYTNTIILLKNLIDLNFKDINSILKEPLNLYQFKNYISK